MQLKLMVALSLPSLGWAQDKITYEDHVFPIFQQSCLNCHNPDKTKGGLDLSSFALTLKGGSGGKVVEPGNPGSPLITCVQQTGEKKMPPEGDKLAGGQIAILLRWIDGGLLENKSAAARKPSKPKFETTLRSDPAAKPDGPPPMPQHLLLEPPVITARPAAIHAIASSPWAPLLAITGQHQILLHHTETLELIGILPFPDGEPVSLAFTPDARHLIVGGGIPGKSGVTVTYDITSGQPVLSVAREFDSVLAADIRPGFDVVVTGGPSRLLKIWNTESGALVSSVKKHTDWITALDVSNDGVLIASGDRNGGVWVWETDTAREFHTLRGHQGAISAAGFRSDSNILATASEDGTVRYWEMNGGSEVRKIDAHPGGVTAFAFSREGLSVTAGRDRKVKLWNADFSPARELAQSLPALPTGVAIDFSGTRAFVADAAGNVHAFMTADAKPVGQIQSNPPTVATRIQQLAKTIHQLDEALHAAQTAPEREAAQAQLARIHSGLKYWTAAAINTEALKCRRLADESALALQDTFLDFTRTATAAVQQSNILNAKRVARAEIDRWLKGNSRSSETKVELAATLAAVKIRLDQETALLMRMEDEITTFQQAIDRAVALTQLQSIQAESLREGYRRALE